MGLWSRRTSKDPGFLHLREVTHGRIELERRVKKKDRNKNFKKRAEIIYFFSHLQKTMGKQKQKDLNLLEEML